MVVPWSGSGLLDREAELICWEYWVPASLLPVLGRDVRDPTLEVRLAGSTHQVLFRVPLVTVEYIDTRFVHVMVTIDRYTSATNFNIEVQSADPDVWVTWFQHDAAEARLRGDHRQ
jgi:hypothetical protein